MGLSKKATCRACFQTLEDGGVQGTVAIKPGEPVNPNRRVGPGSGSCFLMGAPPFLNGRKNKMGFHWGEIALLIGVRF